MTTLARAAALGVLASAALAARPAAAYVRYKTDSGIPFYWPQDCVAVTAYPNDLTDMPPDQTMHAAQAAADAWSKAGDACTYMTITVTSSSGPTPPAAFDYYNNLVFRAQSWCKSGDPTGMCYDPSALAITSVFVGIKDGQIRDADIEVNAKYFVWADLDLDMSKDKQDLQNALTHEMGHLIGLDHTCYTPNPTMPTPRPTDNTGQLVPDCSDAPPAVQATTMFASAPAGDTSKRTLAPDDQQAVCDIYPAAQDPMVCPPPGPPLTQSGCQCGAGGPAAGTWAGAGGLLLAAAALLRARRRKRGPI
jgi:MYXO-CTERM domain-containing protein